MVGSFMNSELARIWNKVVTAQLKHFTVECCILLHIYLILYDAVNHNKVLIH
jgi:hypothetical protein